MQRASSLRAVVSDDGAKPEVLSRIAQATAALTKLKPIWRDNSISLGSKVNLVRSLIISIFLYACESWTLTAELEKRSQTFDLRCYRRLLNISYKDHGINEEIRRKIQAATGKYDELLTLVKKRTLRWFGHVSRSSGLAKTILQQGWSGGAMVLGKLPAPGRPTNLNSSRARAFCACRRCGWGLFEHIFSHLSFLFSFSLSVGDGPI